MFANDIEANLNAIREAASANTQVLSTAIAGLYKLVETFTGKQQNKKAEVE